MVSDADLAARIGCDAVVRQPFDHGAQIGMLAKWGDVRHAVRAVGLDRDVNWLSLADELRKWKAASDG